jgi:hypothetical protein
MTGFIQLHRKILNWEWYDDHNTTRLFIHILMKANYEDKSHHGETIKRGSFKTGRIALANETGLSQQQIRTSLLKLKKSQEITIKSTNKYSVITVVNYDSYQGKDAEHNQQFNQQITNKQPTNNQQITTTNKDNNINNINNITSKGSQERKDAKRGERFSSFWDREHKGEKDIPHEWGAWAYEKYEKRRKPKIDLDKEIEWEFESFKTYWETATGVNASKIDWYKAWQGWWSRKAEQLATKEDRDEQIQNRFTNK